MRGHERLLRNGAAASGKAPVRREILSEHTVRPCLLRCGLRRPALEPDLTGGVLLAYGGAGAQRTASSGGTRAAYPGRLACDREQIRDDSLVQALLRHEPLFRDSHKPGHNGVFLLCARAVALGFQLGAVCHHGRVAAAGLRDSRRRGPCRPPPLEGRGARGVHRRSADLAVRDDHDVQRRHGAGAADMDRGLGSRHGPDVVSDPEILLRLRGGRQHNGGGLRPGGAENQQHHSLHHRLHSVVGDHAAGDVPVDLRGAADSGRRLPARLQRARDAASRRVHAGRGGHGPEAAARQPQPREADAVHRGAFEE